MTTVVEWREEGGYFDIGNTDIRQLVVWIRQTVAPACSNIKIKGGGR